MRAADNEVWLQSDDPLEAWLCRMPDIGNGGLFHGFAQVLILYPDHRDPRDRHAEFVQHPERHPRFQRNDALRVGRYADLLTVDML